MEVKLMNSGKMSDMELFISVQKHTLCLGEINQN